MVIHGDGRQTRDFVYAGDVARANAAAVESEVVGVLNVGTGVETSILELARLAAEAVGVEPRVVFAPPRPGDVRRSFADASRAERELGWRPEVQLREGLRITAGWLRSEYDLQA